MLKFYQKCVKTKLCYSSYETMPKEQKHIPEAQKQRKKIKEKFSKYVPGRISLQVLGTGAEGAPRSLYVFSDQSRYLFNCGEGTQRLAHEHKMKLAKLEHIFITQGTWNNIGGLPGTALTIQDVGVPQITLHGPKGLEEIFSATKRFVIIKDLKIKMADCSVKSVFEDNVMMVRYVPIIKTPEFDNGSIAEGEDGSDSDSNARADNDNSKGVQVITDSLEAGTSTRNEHKRRNSRKRSKSYSSDSGQEVDDDIDYYAHERKKPITPNKQNRSRSYSTDRKQTPVNKNTDNSYLSSVQKSKKEGAAMCYICKLQPRPGALSLDKCVKYGVPSGPLLGKLKMGEDVMLPSGVIVKSKDVCEPDDPGPVFIVVDCPTKAHLESLVSNPVFRNYQVCAKKNEDLAYLVVHFTPPDVINDPRYSTWVDQFSPSTHHLVLNESNTCMGSISVHRVQRKLNLLHNSIFPLLGDKGSKVSLDEKNHTPAMKRMKTENEKQENDKVNLENTGVNSQFENTSVNSQLENLSVKSHRLSPCDCYIYANTFCSFHLRPRKGLDRSSELTLTPNQYIEETLNEEGFSDVLTDLQQKLREEMKKLKIQPYPRLLFLGTGSCIPNKTRNTSGILLESSDHTNILMDCGEGTYGQIVRFFGQDKADNVLANIKAIFISHLHADHHIGLIGLLQGRRKALNRLNRLQCQPVLLLAPKQILTWLNFYDKYFENICQEFELIPNGELLHNEQLLFEGTKVRVFLTLEMSEISTTHVRHCPNAFGIAFKHKNGYKICYSGDTMPSENLIEIGLNCDLLIHEATMEDELEHEAVIKMHSTTSQAIEIGRNMCAKHILLTHFSQRYAKLPRFNDNFDDNIGIAFDNMWVRLDELPLVPLLYPALKIMFAEHYEELEFKAAKRLLKMERQEELIKESLLSTPKKDEPSSSKKVIVGRT